MGCAWYWETFYNVSHSAKHSFSERKPKWNLLNGEHNPQNVVLYASFLGFTSGLGICIVVLKPFFSNLGAYLFSLSLFHTLEYLSTSLSSKQTSLSSFLLNHSPEYHAAIAGSLVEYLIEHFFFPTWFKNGSWLWTPGELNFKVLQKI